MMFGSMIKIKERNLKVVTRTVTAKSEEKSLKDDDFMSPAGHLMFVKNIRSLGGNVRAQLISIGGARMEDGRTWGFANTLISRILKIEDDGLDLGQLTYLKSFQLTSSHNNKTTKGSVIPCLTNSAGVDLDSVAFDNINLILYGGQFTDKIITSDEIINIKGCVMDNISDSQIDVTRYPSEHLNYMEFQVPPGWSDGRELVQKGEISSSRTGHCLSTLKQEGGTALLLCTGGHSKTSITKPFFHPEDSINILKVPEMFWIKLEGNDALKRSFHSQAVNSKGEVIIKNK